MWPYFNLPPPQDNSASFMAGCSEDLLADGLDCLHTPRFVLSQTDCNSIPTKSLLKAAVVCQKGSNGHDKQGLLSSGFSE